MTERSRSGELMTCRIERSIWFGAMLVCSFGCSSNDLHGAASALDSGNGAGGSAAFPAQEGGKRVTIDTGPQSDPEVAYTVTLEMDPFTVGPGKEVHMCQSYANPFQGKQVDIKAYDLDMAKGSHHMFLFYVDGAPDGAVVHCPQGGLSFAPFTLGAQSSPKFTQTFPEGVGAAIPATTGFHMNVRYINTGSDPIQGHVKVVMSVAKPGIVTQHAGVIFLNNTDLVVPPTGQPYTTTQRYTLPQDVYILSSVSHMHQRATNFVSSASTGADASTGTTLFHTDQWDEPPAKIYTPPLHLTAGTTLDWSCTYVNDTPSPLTFGESAAKNVMCIGVNIFYPVADITSPVLGSLL
jgi:hypothetical protein